MIMYSYTGVTNTFQIIHIVTFLQDPKLPKGKGRNDHRGGPHWPEPRSEMT